MNVETGKISSGHIIELVILDRCFTPHTHPILFLKHPVIQIIIIITVIENNRNDE